MANNGVVSPFGLEGPPEPIPPTPGSTQVFIAFSTTPFTPFNGFCPKVIFFFDIPSTLIADYTGNPAEPGLAQRDVHRFPRTICLESFG